jgi:hypothetical protein
LLGAAALCEAIQAFEEHVKEIAERPEKKRLRMASKALVKKNRRTVRKLQLSDRATKKD